MIERHKTVLGEFLSHTSAPIYLQAGLHGGAQIISRQELFARGCALAQKFKSYGVETGDKVMTILPTGKPFLVSTFGTWLSGAAIVPVAPPAPGNAQNYYQRKLLSMIRTAEPKIIPERSSSSVQTLISRLAECGEKADDADLELEPCDEPVCHPLRRSLTLR